MKQYEVWLADLPIREDSHVQGGKRPVAVVSADCDKAEIITIVPLTSQLGKRWKQSHALLIADGVEGDSLALADHIQTIDARLLICRLGYIDKEYDRKALRMAIARHLGLITTTFI